jgi:hypothetical protein
LAGKSGGAERKPVGESGGAERNPVGGSGGADRKQVGENGGADRKPAGGGGGAERKSVLLRLDPAVHDALARWAGDEFRSLNAQVEVVLRDALRRAGRMPKNTAPIPKRGRPPAG